MECLQQCLTQSKPRITTRRHLMGDLFLGEKRSEDEGPFSWLVRAWRLMGEI